jgi:hypothetical protein
LELAYAMLISWIVDDTTVNFEATLEIVVLSESDILPLMIVLCILATLPESGAIKARLLEALPKKAVLAELS